MDIDVALGIVGAILLLVNATIIVRRLVAKIQHKLS